MKCSSTRLEDVASDDMAVSYNRHRQKVGFTKHFDCKQYCGHQDDPENFSVKNVNKRCSPNRNNSGNRPSCDQKTITITVKKKNNTDQKKPKTQQVKKSIAPSLITMDDYLVVLGKKCSTPDALQTFVHRNQKKRRCSDTCLYSSTPFKTKTIVNTVSLDPKKIPPGCKNLLNNPLMQAQLGVYRCQLKKEKDDGCRTCTSAAIFEVVKCLYDCYKKKKCDPCKCVVCGYLPKNIRKLIKEVGTSSVNVGVETPSTNRITRSTMTSEEDELLLILQNEPKPARPVITASEKVRMAKAFGIMTPEASGGIKLDKELHQNDYNTEYMTKIEAPYPKDNVPVEKTLYRTNVSNEDPSIRVPSKKLRKARASGLLTPLDGKTQEQREKMLRNLAVNNIPLPEGKTESEKIVIAKVRRDLGLPPAPKTAAEKERYAKAQAAGLITPLKGKSQPQKENLIRSWIENSIPLPEGRTLEEKAFIENIQLDCLSKAMFSLDTEKPTKNKARSYMQTLFNKFATETGYMVLVETSCIKDRFHNLQIKGLLSSMEVIAPKDEKYKPHSIRPKETKILEKVLFKEVGTGVRRGPESQGKTLIGKPLRMTEKEVVQLHDAELSPRRPIKKQHDAKMLIEERISEPKDKLLPCIAIAGNPFLKSKTSLENLLDRVLKDNARASKTISERTQKPKGSESESEQFQCAKRLAGAILSLTGDHVLKSENINKERYTPKVIQRNTCQTSDVGTGIPQKVSKGVVTNLEAHVNKNLDNGICERSVVCDMKKLSYRNSYLKIKLSLSDISNESTPIETRSVFIDTKDIKQTIDIATSLPSISNSTEADATLDKIPTKEIKKNNMKSASDKYQTSSDCNSTTEDFESNLTFYFSLNDNTDNGSQSQENTREKDFDEKKADLIYIYKPTLEVDGQGKLTTSSRIILTDSYAITPSSSGSLYLIETGSTTSFDSGMTDYSYATKDTSDTETGTGTDVYYMQRSEDECSKDTSSEPRIVWFYRNNVIRDSPRKDAKVYLVSEVKMHQQRDKPAKRTKKPDLEEQWNGAHNSRNIPETAPRQSLKRCSSVFIIMSPSNHEELSSEKMGSLIYIGKLDSVSKLKNIKFVPHENTQKVDPIETHRRHGRNEEAIKYSADPKMPLKCSGIRPELSRNTPYALPVGNASTRYPCNKGTKNQRSGLECPATQIHKQQIPRECLENQKTRGVRSTWNKELQLPLSSSSTTCKLGSRGPEQRMGYSGKQQTGAKNLGMNLNTTGPESRREGATRKPIALYCGKNTTYREKPNKWFPEHQLATMNSKVCLISTSHSSRCNPSKVSFSDDSRRPKRDKPSAHCKDKRLDPEPKICSSKNLKGRKNTDNDSSCYSYDEKARTKREERPQIKLKISPKVSSPLNTSLKSSKGSKVRFDHQCPCESIERGSRPCDHEKNESKTCDGEKKESKPRDSEKTVRKLCDREKKESKSSDSYKKESKPCASEKKETTLCDREEIEAKRRDREKKTESKPCDLVKKNSDTFQKVTKKVSSEATRSKTVKRPCEHEKKSDSIQSSTEQSSLPRGLCSRCRETVKRATSPLEVEVKSVGNDGPDTCRPTDGEQSTAVSPEQGKISKTCSSNRSDAIKISNHKGKDEKPMKDSTDNEECQPAEENIKSSQKEASKCQTNSPQESTAECVKQQMVPEQCSPPNTTPCERPADECEKTHQQMSSECPENSAQDSVTQPCNEEPTPECVKQQMVTQQLCPPNSTPAEQPVDECQKLHQQMASECQENCTQDSIKQPCDDNAQLSQQTPCELPANLTQDTTSQPVNKDVELNQQTPAECLQPTDNNAELTQTMLSECPAETLTEDSTAQPECAPDCGQQPANENDDTCQNVPAPCPDEKLKEKKKKSKRPGILPRASRGSECIPKSQEIAGQRQQPSQVYSDPCPPCSHEGTKHPSDKKMGRFWWHPKKKQIIPPRPVEEQTAETQCERDVRDLAQMTDDLEQMTDGLLAMVRDAGQCHCGEDVKPCQCVQELVTRSIVNAKTNNICECPPPIIIIKGQMGAKENKKDVVSLKQMIDQQLDCPCMDYLDKHNIKYPAKMEQVQSMALPHARNKEERECPLKDMRPKDVLQNEEVTCPEIESGNEKNITCAAGEGGKDVTCQCVAPDQGGKKNISCQCSQPTAVGEGGKDGTCQGLASDQSDKRMRECSRPTNMVKEQTTAIQCPKEAQPSPQNKKQNVNKNTSKDKTKCECRDQSISQKDQKTGGQKNKLSINLGKKNLKTAEHTSSDEGACKCKDNKSGRVNWCQKKYVISECPEVPAEDDSGDACLSPEQQKKNAKKQAKIKKQKKVDSLCTHDSVPCQSNDDPTSKKKKIHKCECPHTPLVEEVDLNSNIKGCPLAPCITKEESEMTEGKVDKCSYTDHPIKDMCKTKHKASGRGKWGKKKLMCICRPDPPMTDTGCDPPCLKEQWKMRSMETHNKSGFSVRKKPAPRVDHAMCFEDALAYFEAHPEDDPMRKKKNKVKCECVPFECYDSHEIDALRFCYGGL